MSNYIGTADLELSNVGDYEVRVVALSPTGVQGVSSVRPLSVLGPVTGSGIIAEPPDFVKGSMSTGTCYFDITTLNVTDERSVFCDAVVYLNHTAVGITEAGKLMLNVSEERVYVLYAEFDGIFSQQVAVQAIAGKTIVVQPLVVISSTESHVVESTPEVPTFPLGPVRVSPAFGSELDSYVRLLYGSETTKGMPSSRFWDMRAFPVPFRPFDDTGFEISADPSALGGRYKIVVCREDSDQEPVTTRDIVLESLKSSLALRLGRGLNSITVFGYDGSKWCQVFSTGVTATVFANVLYGYAVGITSGLWAPLESATNAILGNGGAGLTAPIMSRYDEHLIEFTNAVVFARQLVLNAIINRPASTQALTSLGQACLAQSLVLSRAHTPDINNTSGFNLASHNDLWNTVSAHYWSRTSQQARWVLTPRRLRSQEDLVDHSTEVTVSGTDTIHWDLAVSDPIEARPTIRMSMCVESELEVNVDAHSREVESIKFPGLWDNGEVPFLDLGDNYDSGKEWDSGDTSGDPDKSGWVGTTIVPSTSLQYGTGVGVSVLDRNVAQAEVWSLYRVTDFSVYDSNAVAIDAPTISPASGTYPASQQITITSPVGVIYYTDDGSEPSIQSTPYSGSFALAQSSTIKAVAVSGQTLSSVTSSEFLVA